MKEHGNMTLFLRDRLKGKTESANGVTDAELPGRYRLHPVPGGVVCQNSVLALPDDYLVPDASGKWKLVDRTGGRASGSFVKSMLPDELESNSIRNIGKKLQSLETENAGWLQWVDIVPLEPEMGNVVVEEIFETMIREHFSHLDAVCRKPVTHLRIQVERMPVGRARRYPANAVSFLAAHSEDWERPLVRSVLPKRILAEMREELIDIYENRMTARLIDNIVFYLTMRIKAIKKYVKIFKDKDDYSKDIGGNYRRRARILEIWAEKVQTDERMKQAERRIHEIEHLLHKVLGLIDSVLYRSVPRHAQVSPTLHRTNVLTNDQHYRRIVDLWMCWVKSGNAKVLSTEEKYRLQQELCRGMDGFALLLVLRALKQIGYEPSDYESLVTKESPLLLHGDGHLVDDSVKAELLVENDGSLQISANARKMRFVAFPADLSTSISDRELNGVLESLTEKCDGFIQTMLLYLWGGQTDQPILSRSMIGKIMSIGNDPRTNVDAALGMIPVSPWDIGSVERVARALRWFLDGGKIIAYNNTIELGARVAPFLENAGTRFWLVRGSTPTSLKMVTVPGNMEIELDRIEKWISGLHTERNRAEKVHEDNKNAINRANRERDGRLKKDLEREKVPIHKALEEADQELKNANQLQSGLRPFLDLLKSLFRCPSCGTISDYHHNYKLLDRNCFRCTCQSCNMSWGLHVCSNGHRYPVLLPGSFLEADEACPGWVDRFYGADLLSLPARNEHEKWGYVCPECGEIG